MTEQPLSGDAAGSDPDTGQGLFAPERRQAISQQAAVQGRVSVAELAVQFSVAPETIRRDLDVLERQGRIQRVHGGAISPLGRNGREAAVDDRRATRIGAKAAIARAAMGHLPPAHGSVLLDGGSTTGCLAAAMSAAAREGALEPVTVVTNSPSAGVELSHARDVEVLLLGGRLRPVTETVVGAQTNALLSSISADVAFLGSNGLSAVLGLTTPDAEEAAAKRLIAARSQRVIALVDSTKFGAEHLCTFADLSAIDVLITDAVPPSSLAEALNRAEIEVVIA
ncbi:hypothetical protein KPaMU14_01255 [Kocuria palustris]|nr:hypothetical protein KPaMU14_01255 [Kocuria palustris]